jgi:integrase
VILTGRQLADIPLENLTREDVLEWRDGLREGRSARTINRYTNSVIAGLNAALELGYVGRAETWTVRALADEQEGEGTAVFLTAPERKSLIYAAEPQAGAFLRALELTGARPGEMAAARVRDFEGATLRLAHRKGRPPKLRVRQTVLTAEGIAHLTKAAADKPSGAFLFLQPSGAAWVRQQWGAAVRAAIARHNGHVSEGNRLPVGASAYSFRHARISELLQLRGVDPLTVAAQCGTSLAMIEKNYWRFIPSALQEKLASVRDA